MNDADWVRWEDALAAVLRRVAPGGTERVPLRHALGRALAGDIPSPVDHPPWDNSAMDGFAVRAEDVEGATGETPVTLPISDDVPAGRFPSGPLAAGTAVRVMTGAPVPEGATGVVRVEHTDGGDGARVRVFESSDARRNIRPRAEDIETGRRLLARGDEIDPAAVALLALAGVSEVPVGRRPRIGVLANGDELAGFENYDEVRAGRRIMNSNGPALAAQLEAAGAEPVPLGIARDDPGSVRERLEACEGCDGLVSAAGVSVGDHDYVRPVLASMGFERVFWRVKMRPGSAALFGTLRGRPCWGVPGNPVSAMVTFEVLVRPAVRRMAGYAAIHRRPLRCRAAEAMRGPADVASFLRVRIEDGDDDLPRARLTGPQGSGVLTSMRADGLLVVPEGTREIAAGGVAQVIPLRPWSATA